MSAQAGTGSGKLATVKTSAEPAVLKQRNHQSGLSPYAIAVVAKHGSTNRTRQKPHAEGRETSQGAHSSCLRTDVDERAARSSASFNRTFAQLRSIIAERK